MVLATRVNSRHLSGDTALHFSSTLQYILVLLAHLLASDLYQYAAEIAAFW